MEKIDALQTIKETWDNNNIPLGEKIILISSAFYSSGLDLASTAAYIKATPVELEAFLSLSEFDDKIISLISKAKPPKTTWIMLSNASDEETIQALYALVKNKNSFDTIPDFTFSEFVYKKMLEVSGPSKEQRISNLCGDDLKYIEKKGENYDALGEWEIKFLKSIASQKKRGKVLSEKQISKLIDTLEVLVHKRVIIRNSIDGDQEICDRILDALGKE